MSGTSERKFGKWHFLALLVFLYALVVVVSLVTNQPPEVMELVLKEGGAVVGIMAMMVAILPIG